MGYTHYWTFKKTKQKSQEVEKVYQTAIKECNKVILYYQKNAESWERLSGYSAHCKNGQYGGINFNGKGKYAHENFYLREHFNQNFDNFGKGFNFCKTARKYYDIVVIACLSILKYRLKDNIDISSDGFYNEWIDGVNLAQKVIKRKVKNPIPFNPEHDLKAV